METGETFHNRKKLKYTTLPDITRRVIEARQSGSEEDVIKVFLRKRGYTPASFEKAVNKQSSKDELRPAEEQGGGFWDTVTDGLTYFNKATDSLMTGRTFGLSIPARALGRWAKKQARSLVSSTEAESLSESADAIQDEDTQWREENPNVAMATEVAGGIAGGMGAGKAVTTAAPVLAPVAGQTGRNLLKGAATYGGIGAVEGGGTSAAKDENVILGTGIGGVTGVVGDLAVPVVKWVAKKLASPIQKLFGKTPKKELTKAEIKGGQMLEEVDQKDGITLVQKEMKLAEYKKHGLGDEVMEVDLLGKKGQNLAGTIMRHGDKVPDAAETALVKRAGGVRQHIYNFLQDATGGTRVSLKKTAAGLRKTAKESSNPVYDTAFYVGGKSGGKMKTVSDEGLNDLFKMPEFKKAYKRAIYLAKHDIPPVKLDPIPTKEITLPSGKKKIVEAGFPEGHEFPVYALDKVKKALGSKFGRNSIFHPDSNVQALSAKMTGHKNTMLDIIGETVPEYKEARRLYAGQMELKDATELGEKLFDSGDSMDKIFEFSTKLKTESEKKAFRNAAFNVLSKKIEASSVNPKGMAQYFLNEQNMHKLQLLIPDPEARGIFIRQNELLSGFIDIKNKVLAGSQSVEKLAADAAEEEMNQGLRAAANVANRNPAGLMLQAQEFGGGARRAARLDEAGSKMYQQTSPKIQADHEASLITNKLLKEQMRGKTLLESGAAGGGASLMNSLLQ
jgi:hypothetical protein